MKTSSSSRSKILAKLKESGNVVTLCMLHVCFKGIGRLISAKKWPEKPDNDLSRWVVGFMSKLVSELVGGWVGWLSYQVLLFNASRIFRILFLFFNLRSVNMKVLLWLPYFLCK